MWRLVWLQIAIPVIVLEVGDFVYRHTFRATGLINILFYVAASVASLVLHELGHALTAKAVGFGVPRINLGVGRRIFKTRVASTEIHVHASLISGLTILSAAQRQGLRWRIWLTTLAGPAVTASLCAVAVLLGNLSIAATLWPMKAFITGPAFWSAFAFCNVTILFLNILPFSVLRGRGVRNDGEKLFWLPFCQSNELEMLLMTPSLLQFMELIQNNDIAGATTISAELEARFPGHRIHKTLRASLLLRARNFREAYALYDEILADTLASKKNAALAQNNVAWVAFCLRDRALLQRAEELAQLALKGAPNIASIVGTRAAIHLWKAQHHAALPLLERAYSLQSDVMARALNACCLALTHAGLDDKTKANKWLVLASQHDSTCHLLPEATAAVAALG